MRLNKEGTLAQINVNGEKTAEEIEEIMENLALLREQMTPPVAQKKNDATLLHIVDDPQVEMSRLKTGGIRLYARSPALGWIALSISKDNSPALSAWLLANMENITNLVEPSLSNRDTPRH